MLKILFSKRCASCLKPHAKNQISIFDLCIDSWHREMFNLQNQSVYLCDVCYSEELTRKKVELEKEEKRIKIANQEKYTTELRSLVEVLELEAQAIEFGIDVIAIKSKYGISD
ncbi:hypothetical protein [Viridibacillus arvi]|uniref:hypothetical protein n=1 Tax=Viridibacillus arvi TaxID=263475 RepID=UPI0034CDE2E4